MWSIDFTTDLPLSQGVNSIYTYINKFTKTVKLLPYFVCEGQLTAKEVAMLLFNGVVRTYGRPRVVLHNWDLRFTSHFCKSLCTLLWARMALGTAHHSHTGGQMEHAHHLLE